jgi:hypothetical protein
MEKQRDGSGSKGGDTALWWMDKTRRWRGTRRPCLTPNHPRTGGQLKRSVKWKSVRAKPRVAARHLHETDTRGSTEGGEPAAAGSGLGARDAL